MPVHISYATQTPADFHATSVAAAPSGGVVVQADTPAGPIRFESPLVGAFNAANILAAAAAAHALGCPPPSWTAGTAALRQVPGRMEAVNAGQPFRAYVDFAHTPNGLRSALGAARHLAADDARVLVVFGCAGLRDPGKRGPMGRAAGELADVIVVTAEDPRTETLEEINAEIARGVSGAGGRQGRVLLTIADRMDAIREAVARAHPGDVVLVCGKGHEQSMCFGDVEYPWDDRAALRAALAGAPYGALPTARTRE